MLGPKSMSSSQTASGRPLPVEAVPGISAAAGTAIGQEQSLKKRALSRGLATASWCPQLLTYTVDIAGV